MILKLEENELLPLIGYFDSPEQTTPAYDPPHDSPCLICERSLAPDDVRTLSIMLADGVDDRSFFYRVHRTCHEVLTREERDEISGRVFDALGR